MSTFGDGVCLHGSVRNFFFYDVEEYHFMDNSSQLEIEHRMSTSIFGKGRWETKSSCNSQITNHLFGVFSLPFFWLLIIHISPFSSISLFVRSFRSLSNKINSEWIICNFFFWGGGYVYCRQMSQDAISVLGFIHLTLHHLISEEIRFKD